MTCRAALLWSLAVLAACTHAHAEDILATAMDFFEPEYKTGVLYVQSSELHQETTVALNGQSMDQVMDMTMTNEMTVTDLPEGGKEISITYTRITMDMDMSIGMSLHYDSNDKDDASQQNNPFAIVGGLVGEPLKVLVDDDYNVVKMELNDKDSVLAALQSNDATKDLASAKQLEQATSLARSLPAIGVVPGDSWDFDLDLDGDMMRFAGQGTFVGYGACGNGKQEECAEIHMEGTMDMDMEQVGEVLGSNNHNAANMVKEMVKSTKIKEGTMVTDMQWDVNDKFARSTTLEMSMVMQMMNPTDPTSTMDIPIHQTIKTTVDIME